jgi:hypothetical protein
MILGDCESNKSTQHYYHKRALLKSPEAKCTLGCKVTGQPKNPIYSITGVSAGGKTGFTTRTYIFDGPRWSGQVQLRKKAKWDKTLPCVMSLCKGQRGALRYPWVVWLLVVQSQVHFSMGRSISGDGWSEIRIVYPGWSMAVDLQRWHQPVRFFAITHSLEFFCAPHDHTFFAIDCQNT